MENKKKPIHDRNLSKRVKTISQWKTDKKNITKFKEFLDKAALGQVNQGKKLGEATLLKYCDMLKIAFENINKDFSKITKEDVEKFEKWLTKQKYQDSTKAKLKIQLKVYLRWLLGTDKGNDVAGWLDTKIKTKTPDYLSESEIEKLFKECKDIRERFLIAILFDSGARAEEFHNIRKEDIQLPNKNESYVKLTLKEEYSKTKGRVISLYWKHSLNAVRDFLDKRKEIKPSDILFDVSYDYTRKVLHRLGKKILNKSIHYHLFRHSSATYYAGKLNRQELCYRYGWAFSSDMPDVYISRAGMMNKELDEKFKSTDLENVEKELERVKFNAETFQQDIGLQLIEQQKLIKELMEKQLQRRSKK